ncbi:MAG: glycoside hydrolase family 15 [Alphaproteobacteria bacterium]|nr:glycoside hydrolase family 15 [Alphaproteobacteria bacterium]
MNGLTHQFDTAQSRRPGRRESPAGRPFKSILVSWILVVAGLCLLSQEADAAAFVTGNGFGFAVVTPSDGALTKFYAHPYSFVRPDPQKPLSEGVATVNFIKSLRWTTLVAPQSLAYMAESHVIQVRSASGEGLYFMPFGWNRNALIVAWRPAPAMHHGAWKVAWAFPITSHIYLRGANSGTRLVKFEGIEEKLLLIPLDRTGRTSTKGLLTGARAWALVPLEPGDDPRRVAQDFRHWRKGLSARALADRELAEFERWRVAPTVHFLSEEERRLWRQSESILRMSQNREPNRAGRYGNGFIVASLPDSLWFTPWVRDMAYATAALTHMGHTPEARAALLAYFNARPTGVMRNDVGGMDYQVSVARYFGDGAEEPYFTMEGSTNIEFDDWGLVLWVLGEYLRQVDDTALLREQTYRGSLYEAARDYVAKPLIANLEPHSGGLIVAADTSIWEERQKDKKHFAFTTAAAIAGLRAFADIAHRAGDETTRAEILEKLRLLEIGFSSAFVRGSTLHGTLENGPKNDIDGALLAAIDLGVVDDPALLRSTVERMALLKVASGGYRRVRSTLTDPQIFEYWYERQEFVFVDLHLAEVYRRLGRHEEADALLGRIVTKAAADHYVVPEMYVAEDCPLFHGALGDPTGAIPMVGYGAGAYIDHVLQRARLSPP